MLRISSFFLPLCVAAMVAVGAPTAPPAEDKASEKAAPGVADPKLADRLKEIDKKAAVIEDFSSTFKQEKFTALLRKPLVSSGTVRVKRSTVRWDTQKPERVTLFSDGKELKMYYPTQKVVEVYPIDRKLAELAASPIPRLNSLSEHFAIKAYQLKDFVGENADAENLVALELTPIDKSLAEHVDAVHVLLDVRAAHILKVETIDTDGDRTVISFGDIKLNTGLKPADVELTLPKDTKTVRPLEGGEK